MRQIISFNNKNWELPEPWVQPRPANDEIWYTSSDGNIVKPYNTSSLPTIVSNTYVGGKGVIKCASNIIVITDKTFKNCTSLTSVSFGDSVTYIGGSAFSNCSGLTSVTIPNSVTSIGYQAFYGCSSLTSISYTGTIAQYNAIDKGSSWNTSVPATVVHCTDGDAPI